MTSGFRRALAHFGILPGPRGQSVERLFDPSLPYANGDRLVTHASMRAMFTRPQFGALPLNGLEFAPFAFWLIEALKPRDVVQLGLRSGNLYFALCQGIDRLGLKAQCRAVYPLVGDATPGGRVQAIHTYNDLTYSHFSQISSSTYDAAAADFASQSIDLLHVDLNGLEADGAKVFEAWQDKLSPQAVLLLSGINGAQTDFASWATALERYRRFDFIQGGGLAVFGVGARCPDAIARMLEAGRDEFARDAIREIFGYTGQSCLDGFSASELSRLAERQASKDAAASEEIRMLKASHDNAVEGLRAQLSQLKASLEVAQADLSIERSAAESLKKSRASDQKYLEVVLRDLDIASRDVNRTNEELSKREASITQLHATFAQGRETFEQVLASQRRMFDEQWEEHARLSSSLESHNTELKRALTEATRKAEALDAKVAELTGQVGERDRKLADMTRQLANRDHEAAELGKQLKDRDFTITQTTGQLAERDQRITELTHQLAGHEGRISDLTGQLTHHEGMVAELGEARKEAEARADEGLAREKTLADALAAAQTQARDASYREGALTDALMAAEADATAANDLITELSEELGAAKAETQEAKALLERRDEEIQAQSAAIAEMGDALARTEEQASLTLDRAEAVEAELEKALLREADAQDLIATQQGQIADLAANGRRRELEFNMLTELFTAAEQSREDAQGQLLLLEAVLKEERAARDGERGAHTAMLAAASEQAASLEARNADLNEQLQALAENLVRLQEQASHAEERAGRAEERASEAEGRAFDSEAELARAGEVHAEHVEQLTRNINSLSNLIETIQDDNHRLQRSLSSVEEHQAIRLDEIKALTQDFLALERRLADANDDIDAKQNYILSLEGTVNFLETEREKIKVDYEKVVEDLLETELFDLIMGEDCMTALNCQISKNDTGFTVVGTDADPQIRLTTPIQTGSHGLRLIGKVASAEQQYFQLFYRYQNDPEFTEDQSVGVLVYPGTTLVNISIPPADSPIFIRVDPMLDATSIDVNSLKIFAIGDVVPYYWQHPAKKLHLV